MKLLDLVLRDYVYSWYDKLLPQFLASVNCEHEELFPNAVREVASHVCKEMVKRMKVADSMNPMVNFFTAQVIEEIKVHVGLYRQADQKVPRAFRTQIDKQGITSLALLIIIRIRFSQSQNSTIENINLLI